MAAARIARIDWAQLEGRRPRSAGANARLLAHGARIRADVARIELDDGSWGFGRAVLGRAQAERALGARVDPDALTVDRGCPLFAADTGPFDWRLLEYPLWDLAGRRERRPVYALAAERVGRAPPATPLRAPVYDTSLYMDDVGLDSDRAAAELIASEACEGYARGHRAFKVKVGRGARHLSLQVGTRRDIAVVRAVREAIGPACALMIDANNGYNLNLTRWVLSETADCGLFWIEEAFHEDAVLYRELREWQQREGLSVLIADGEGEASPSLLDWGAEGLIDVVQFDIFAPGFSAWLAVGPALDKSGVRSAPHHYQGYFGNFVSGHLASAIRNFSFVEWDEAALCEVDSSAYRLDAGAVTLPDAPGFGLELDRAAFARAVDATGYSLSR